MLCVRGLRVCAFVRVVRQLGPRGHESLGRQGMNLPPYAGSAYHAVQPSCLLASSGYLEEEEAPFGDDLKMDMMMKKKKMKAS